MSFLSVKQLNSEQIEKLFQTAIFFKTKEVKPKLENKIVSLVFFEPSTRTRMSFEIAALRLGAKTHLLNSRLGTSLEKDETLEDTVKNIAAMKPDLMVIRCNDDLSLAQMSEEVSVPILNAGWGTQGHPTQALLDILTIKEKGRNLKNERILFVGDVKHSRVVSSHLELAPLLGYRVGFCAPEEMLIAHSGVERFNNLSEGLKWATSVYSLRVQFERYSQQEKENQALTTSQFVSQFQLNTKSLSHWNHEGLILHPGPVNYGVELASEIIKDSRNVILNQVEHGVLIRMALIYHYLKEKL